MREVCTGDSASGKQTWIAGNEDLAHAEFCGDGKGVDGAAAAKRAELEAAIAKFEARIATSPMDGATYPPN